MAAFQRAHDPDRPGQLLLRRGEPVAVVYWLHDFADRAQTGWFMELLDDAGEPDGRPPLRLDVSADVGALAGDTQRPRVEWLARAEAVELVTADAALRAGEHALTRRLGGGAA